MTQTDTNICPNCAADLSYGDGSKFTRKIGIEWPAAYDGVLFWQCPYCHGRWHRFPENHPLRELAECYIQIRPSNTDVTTGV